MDLLSVPTQDILKKSMLEGTELLKESSEIVAKCAVTSCTNDSNTEIGGRKLLLHSPPSSPTMRKFWIEAVPGLADQNKKVCEAHFLSQSSKIGMFPSLKLETRKRKQAIANGNLPVITVRKQVAMKPGFAGSLSSSTSTSDTQPVLPQPRKVIRVIHKSNVIKPANDARPMQAATATVTVARPINLMDIMGEMSNAASTSTAVRNKTMDVNNSRTIDVNPAMASTSFAIPVLTNQKVENDSEECSGDHDDSTKDPSCQKCISQLPAIRKSLVRLESRLDTMLTMARTLLARAHTNQNQFGQRPVYTINTKTRVLFPPPTPTDSIPTVSNVKIVKKISDLTGGRKPSWPAPKKLI